MKHIFHPFTRQFYCLLLLTAQPHQPVTPVANLVILNLHTLATVGALDEQGFTLKEGPASRPQAIEGTLIPPSLPLLRCYTVAITRGVKA